ncbi:hypothetical protein ACEWY4_010272 [Coilia grayii]|uniref:THAP-type domain-containing protein n=1 Tax=Coilia grayii TaxID=363190 RepID=A0ABD1K1I0_9TELE
MVKRCAWGICNTDSHFPERLEGGVRFFPFPKPKSNPEKCRLWIKLCGRPHSQLNPSRINKHSFVCSKHFVNGEPSPDFPNPVPAIPGEGSLILIISLCFYTENQINTEYPNQDGTEDQDEVNQLKRQLAAKEKENALLREEIQTYQHIHTTPTQTHYPLTPETISNCNVPKYLKYCTGYSYDKFNKLCAFFRIPSTATNTQTRSPVTYHRVDQQINLMPLRQQFLLVLMKLRQNFDLKELAFKFQIPERTVSTVLNSWIDFMYGRLGNMSVWPHRDSITENMPDNYREEFPSTFAILDCTEIKTEKPTSLLLQSQTYSNYKSANTLKCLIACDPRGAIIFVSTLYTGSISDQELFRKCGIKDLLRGLLQCGYLKPGDGLMADKGFLIDKDVKDLGLNLNMPPFAKSNSQMPATDVEKTKKIAKHRVHVERAIAKVKKFKIVSGRIPNVRLGNINQVWFVVCMLSNFQPNIIKA